MASYQRLAPTSTIILSALCLLASFAVSAQDLDAFLAAAAADGVNVIPFPDLRRDASSIADEVERRKIEATKYDHSLLERQKNNMLEAIKKTQDDIKKKQTEIEEFKKTHPDGDTRPLEDDIKDLEDDLKDHQDEVKEVNETLEDAAEAWGRLWNARGGLREVFDDVIEELRDARSSPENFIGKEASSEDIDKLKRYIDVIEDEIEVEAKEHLKQEEGAKLAQQKFLELLQKNQL